MNAFVEKVNEIASNDNVKNAAIIAAIFVIAAAGCIVTTFVEVKVAEKLHDKLFNTK